eukprot:2188085-Pyramimonas_sp.AAC.1
MHMEGHSGWMCSGKPRGEGHDLHYLGHHPQCGAACHHEGVCRRLAHESRRSTRTVPGAVPSVGRCACAGLPGLKAGGLRKVSAPHELRRDQE